MKIIISEEQFDKHKQKMLDSVNKFGFLETVDMLGINRMRLAQIINFPIKGDTFFKHNEIMVGQLLKDLVELDDVYNGCELDYIDGEGTIAWRCNFDNKYYTNTYATPYYTNNDSTPIETIGFMVDENDYFDIDGYIKKMESPTEFKNIDELIRWFENEYKPTVYKTIKIHLKFFKEKYNL
jgi:hypothetical protein